MALSLCVLMASFNRRAQTMRCLQALFASSGLGELRLHVILVDDGSSDGTAQAVTQAYPEVQLLRADGTLYWCRAMHLAFAQALKIGFDHYLWLNDDTLVQPDALQRLLACDQGTAPVIVAGSAVDAQTGQPSYGGHRRISRWRLTSWRLVPAGPQAQSIDIFDGNLVLINAAAAARVGNLDPAFEHAMGDTDYALRALRLGIAVRLAPGVLATCTANRWQGSFLDPALPRRERWRLMQDRKGLPWRSWLHFVRRHTGPWWPGYFVWPYLKVMAK